MKVYISADMEGTAGVVTWDQVNAREPAYQAARGWMIEEVNAAIEGALSGGATYVLVNDSHWTMRNLLPSELHPKAELISGNLKPGGMVAGLDGTFGCALFTGYHAAAGTSAILSHTYSDERVFQLRLNGRSAGETALNAMVAGHHGVPVAMVSGDDRLAAEVRDWLGDIEIATVKFALSHYSARTLPRAEACRLIREAARRAVERRREGEFKPLRLGPPIAVEVMFLQPAQADVAALMPGAERVDGVTVRYLAPDALVAHEAFRSMVRLASTV